MNKSETIAIVKLVRRLPNSPITDDKSLDETVELFLAVLGDLPVDMARAATIQYLSESNPFFPSPGALRDKALDLQLLAIGIPTAGEAWGMVLNAVVPTSRWCEIGASLRDAVQAGSHYWGALREYDAHVTKCSICQTSGLGEDYKHPAVSETVKLLGGRDAILTNNPTADRARFIEAYREVVAREKMKMGMVPAVSSYVEKMIQTNEQVALLADKLSVRQEMTGYEDARRAALDRGE